MVTRVPAAPEVLKWAREACALDIEDAAKRLGIKSAHLKKIEDEGVQPSVTTFRAMARVYALPEATLLAARPLRLPPLPTDHRTFEGIPAALTYETIVAIRRVRERQDTLAELAEVDPTIPTPALPTFSLRDNPNKIGEQERMRIGFSIAEQLKLPIGRAHTSWRVLVEKLGVSVFIEDFPQSDSRGISLYENEFPAIILNRNEKHPGARSFTLFHEYGHLLIRQPGLSDQKPSSAIERFCNQLAAAFLMPLAAINAVFASKPSSPHDYSLETLAACAARLSVSMRALALRLEELEFAPTGYFASVNARLGKPTKKKAAKSGGPAPEYMILSHMGHNYTGAVLQTLDNGHISAVEASRLIGAPPKHFANLRQTLTLRRAATTDAG